MVFKIAQLLVDATFVNHLEFYTSPHTGRQLRRIEITFTIADTDPELVFTGVDDLGILSGASSDELSTRWRLITNRHSWTDGICKMYDVSAELEEIETLSLEWLSIEDTVLRPYLYDESLEQDKLIIIAHVELDPSKVEEIRTIETLYSLMKRESTYFYIKRHGINDEPLKVRFGRLIWSKTQHGAHKYQLIFVDSRYDEEESSNGLLKIHEPEFSNMRSQFVTLSLQFQTVVRFLVEKGILSETDMSRISDFVSENQWMANHNLFEVPNVDIWDK